MQQRFETAPLPSVSSVNEDLILAEIERLLDENWSENGRNSDVAALSVAGPSRLRPLSLMIAACIALGITLLPAVLRKANDAGNSAHQVMREAARGSLSE